MADTVPKFANLLFDLDGTLTDPKLAITGSIREVLAELEAEVPPAGELEWCIGPTLREIFSKLLGPRRRSLVDAAVALYLEQWKLRVSKTRVYPGVAEMLERLARSGIRLFLATAKVTEHAETVLSAFSLRRHFQDVFGAHVDGRLSYKTDLVRFILEDRKLHRSSTAIVGDRDQDILAGKRNGIFTIGVSYGYGSREELASAGADRICDSVAGLLELAIGGR